MHTPEFVIKANINVDQIQVADTSLLLILPDKTILHNFLKKIAVFDFFRR